jgi:hypothetical protein
MNKADWAILAYDISELISRGEYPIDICAASILPNLPTFIAACETTQRDLDQKEANA